jgi:multiple sugar transport system substrate-binding protein
VFASAPSGADAALNRTFFTYLANAFHKQTGATVNWHYYVSSTQESSTVESSIATRSGPDIFSVGSSFEGTLAGTNGFHALTASDWNTLGGRSSFESQLLTSSGSSPTDDIGVPFESIPYVLAYNKALLKKAGITSPPTTWTQFVADAKSAQKANPGSYGAGIDPADAYDPWKEVWSYALQSGGNLLNSAGTQVTMATAPWQAAMAFYFAQDVTYHIVNPASMTWNSTNLEAAFAAGKVALLPDATYVLQSELAGTPVANEVGFAPMPDVPLGMSTRPAGAPTAQSIVSGNYWSIADYTSSIPLALQFIKVSTSEAVQLEQFKLLGENPVTNTALTALGQSTPAMTPFITAEANMTPLPFTPAWSYIELGLLAAIGHTADQVATSGSYSPSFVTSQLQAEDAAVQPHLKTS